MKNLTHLYLENNRISRIENLPVSCLQKLYLNENNIEVVENVECMNLTELHVASQRLPPFQPLRFNPEVLGKRAAPLERDRLRTEKHDAAQRIPPQPRQCFSLLCCCCCCCCSFHRTFSLLSPYEVLTTTRPASTQTQSLILCWSSISRTTTLTRSWTFSSFPTWKSCTWRETK